MTTMSTKETLFKNTLVPLGQLCEVLLQGLNTLSPLKIRTEVAQNIFELLNLASCFSVNPLVSDERIAVLETALGLLRYQVLVSFNKPTGSNSSVETELQRILGRVKSITPALHEAMEYSPSLREVWLKTHTDTGSPLTAGGRVNRWRTFARHCDWDFCLEALPPSLFTKARHTQTRLQRRNRLAGNAAMTLWQQTFGSTLEAPVAEEPATERLPQEMSIKVTPAGRLDVRIDFNPSSMLSTSQLATLERGTVSRALTDALKPRYFMEGCTPQSLEAVVLKGRSWLETQKADKEIVEAAYSANLKDRLREKVKAKLDHHFSTAERVVLAELLGVAAPGI